MAGVATAETRLVRPDLIVSRLDVAGTAVARAARGGRLTLRNVTVKNAAATSGYAPASALKFYLSDDQTRAAATSSSPRPCRCRPWRPARASPLSRR